MRIKKFLQLSAAAAALTLTLTMGVTALAAVETTVKGPEGGLSIRYKAAGTAKTLDKTVNVTLSIDKAVFTYNRQTEEVWNRKTGKVEVTGTRGWEDGTTATVTVKNNNSETGVQAQFGFIETGSSEVKIKVADETLHILQPSGTEGDTLTTTVEVISGVPTSDTLKNAGTFKVYLTEAEVKDLTTTS